MQVPRVLRYVEASTRAGRVLIVMSPSGVVDIVLAEHGESSGDLAKSVQTRFPNAFLIPDNGAHRSWVAAAVARLNGAHADFVVPLDLAWSAPFAPSHAPARIACEQAS